MWRWIYDHLQVSWDHCLLNYLNEAVLGVLTPATFSIKDQTTNWSKTKRVIPHKFYLSCEIKKMETLFDSLEMAFICPFQTSCGVFIVCFTAQCVQSCHDF